VKPFSVHPGDLLFSPVANPSFVMPDLVPGIHPFLFRIRVLKTWMAGTSPAMTVTSILV
jgi:hypothetical protein